MSFYKVNSGEIKIDVIDYFDNRLIIEGVINV